MYRPTGFIMIDKKEITTTLVQMAIPTDINDQIIIRLVNIPKFKRPLKKTYLLYLIEAGLKATAGKEWK